MNHTNPYIAPEAVDPTLAMMSQKFLKGVPQERIDDITNGMDEFLDFIEGKDYDFEKVSKFYSAMCVDITNEKNRIGGDWAIAQAVPTRKFRDHIRKELGPNLVFAVIHMSKEDQMARIKARHGEEESLGDMLTKCYDSWEPAADDEPNTIHVPVTRDMTRDDVFEKVLRLINNFGK